MTLPRTEAALRREYGIRFLSDALSPLKGNVLIVSEWLKMPDPYDESYVQGEGPTIACRSWFKGNTWRYRGFALSDEYALVVAETTYSTSDARFIYAPSLNELHYFRLVNRRYVRVARRGDTLAIHTILQCAMAVEALACS